MKRYNQFLAVLSKAAKRTRLVLTLTLICAASSSTFADDPVSHERDLYPDTWYAVDALGRHTPTSEEVGTVKTDKKRTVGIFYITWHTQGLSKLPYPYTSDVRRYCKKRRTRVSTRNIQHGAAKDHSIGESRKQVIF